MGKGSCQSKQSQERSWEHILRRGTSLIAFVVLLSACGSDATTTPTPTTSPPGATTSSPTATQPPESSEEPPSDFYAGETFTFIVPTAPGGGPDLTARFLAEWLPNYIEGSPAITVENMPGGGHIIGSNYFSRQVPRDGLTSIMMSISGHLAWIYDLPGVEFNVDEWEPLMTIGGGNVWIASPEYSGITSLDDLIDGNHEPLYMSGETVGSNDLFNAMVWHLLGIETDVTWGYEGGGTPTTAFEQGESNVLILQAAAYPLFAEPLIEAGEAVVLFTMGQLQADGTVLRDPVWPDVPHIAEVYEMMHGEPPSGDLWDAVSLGSALQRTLGRVAWVHGDDPEEAIAALRHGFEEAVADPAFLEASREVLGDYPPTVGEQARDAVQNLLFDVDRAVIDFIVEFAREQYDHDLRAP